MRLLGASRKKLDAPVPALLDRAALKREEPYAAAGIEPPGKPVGQRASTEIVG